MRRGASTWLVAALAPAVFLAFDPGGWYPFGPAKWLVLTVGLLGGAAVVAARGTWRCERGIGWSLVALLALLGLGAAAGLEGLYAWTGTPERAFGLFTWFLCALALVVGQSLDPERDGPKIVVGLVVAALGVGGVATAEALGWDPGPIGLGGARLTATFGSAAYLGAACALLVPVAVGAAVDRGLPGRLRVVAGVAVATLAVATVGSGARAAWVGLVVALGVGLWCRREDLAGHGRTVAIGGLFALVALTGLAVLSPMGGRIASTFDADSPGGRGRVDEWRVATRVIARHPVTGVGPEGYRIAFAEGVNDRYQQRHGRDPLPDRAHAAPLDVALAGGVGAAVAWLAVVGLVGRSVVLTLRRGRPWSAGLSAGLLAFVVGELLLFPTAELDPVVWLLGGLVVAVAAEARRPLRDRPLPRAVAPALVAAAVVASVVGTVGLAADRRAERAVEALAAGDGPAAVRRIDGAIELRPDVLRYRLLLGRARAEAGEGYRSAIAADDDALRLSPHDPIARLDRVRDLVARARATTVPAHASAARRAAEDLVEDDPSNAAGWQLVGAADELTGRADEAITALRRAEHLAPRDPGPSTDLALLYLSMDRRAEARRAVARALARDPDDARAREVAKQIREG